MMIESFDKKLYVNILDHLFGLQEVLVRESKSKEFDIVEKPKKRKVYIPSLSHPWKQASFQAYLAKQKHRQNTGANV